MAAAAFKGIITIQYMDGDVQQEAFSASDVSNAFTTFDSSGLTFFNTRKRGVIADISLSAAGTDTNKLRLFLNNKDSGISYLNAGIVATVNNRIPVPYPVEIFTQIQLKQLVP